jgi:hypothetical protein
MLALMSVPVIWPDAPVAPPIKHSAEAIRYTIGDELATMQAIGHNLWGQFAAVTR